MPKQRHHRRIAKAAAILQPALDHLAAQLPAGNWNRYFEVRKAGRYAGIARVCPVCAVVPPTFVNGIRVNKWRWLTLHITLHSANDR